MGKTSKLKALTLASNSDPFGQTVYYSNGVRTTGLIQQNILLVLTQVLNILLHAFHDSNTKNIYISCVLFGCVLLLFFYLFSTDVEVEQVTSKQNCLLKLVYKLTLSCIITPCGKKCIL